MLRRCAARITYIHVCMWVAMTTVGMPQGARRAQTDRRARTRDALLEVAARGVVQVRVHQSGAGACGQRGRLHTRRCITCSLARKTWRWRSCSGCRRPGTPRSATSRNRVTLLMRCWRWPRGHAVYCRRDVARVMMILRVEFTGQDYPVGRAISQIVDWFVADCPAHHHPGTHALRPAHPRLRREMSPPLSRRMRLPDTAHLASLAHPRTDPRLPPRRRVGAAHAGRPHDLPRLVSGIASGDSPRAPRSSSARCGRPGGTRRAARLGPPEHRGRLQGALAVPTPQRVGGRNGQPGRARRHAHRLGPKQNRRLPRPNGSPGETERANSSEVVGHASTDRVERPTIAG